MLHSQSLQSRFLSEVAQQRPQICDTWSSLGGENVNVVQLGCGALQTRRYKTHRRNLLPHVQSSGLPRSLHDAKPRKALRLTIFTKTGDPHEAAVLYKHIIKAAVYVKVFRNETTANVDLHPSKNHSKNTAL